MITPWTRRPSIPCWWTSSSRTPSSSTSTPSPTPPAPSCRRHHGASRGGIPPATARASCRRSSAPSSRDDSRLHAPRRALKVIGLMNVQYASRTMWCRARGESAGVAHRAVLSRPRACRWRRWPEGDGGADARRARTHRRHSGCGVFVAEPVFPFVRFPGVDTILGPEMKSTGEVMGGSELASRSPRRSSRSVSGCRKEDRVRQCEQRRQRLDLLPICATSRKLGFHLIATRGTAAYLRAYGLDVDAIYKVNEGGRTSPMRSSTARSSSSTRRSAASRSSTIAVRAAMMHQVPCITTLTAPRRRQRDRAIRQEGLIRALRDYYAGIAAQKV